MNLKTLSTAVATAMLAVGCASYETPVSDSADFKEVKALKARLAQQEAEKATLRSEIASLEASKQAIAADSGATTSTEPNADLPMNARPGECYARVFEPPQYTSATRQVLSRAASETLDVIPATYEWVEQTVMTKPKGVRLETVPARYEWAEQTLVIEPQRTDLVQVPARYETRSEQVLVREAYTTWKKGRGPIERLNEATGEIMCLVEVPAEYKTVESTVMIAGPTAREEISAAKTRVVKTQVLVEPARTVEVEIPAEYETIKVRKLVTAAREQRTEIPAEYQAVEETRMTKEGKLRWQSILCETNASPTLVTDVQRSLDKAGFNPGPIDGVLGRSTMNAIGEFQRANGLASGQLTIETLKALDVDV